MKIASHNSWSYLTPRKWWMRLFSFTAKCQCADIKTQYHRYNVRCFDLRLKFEKNVPVVVHNHISYKISEKELHDILRWLNNKGNVAVRVLLDVRNERQYTAEQQELFTTYCIYIEKVFPLIKFWCGRNLYNWDVEYDFSYKPTCEEKYTSVCKPKIIDDWWPWPYAVLHNRKSIAKGTDKEYLMIDFVNIQ